MASVNSTVIARVAAGLYDLQLGNASMTWALNAVDSVTYGGDLGALVQQLYNTDFKGAGNAALAANIVKNVGITGDAAAVTYVTNVLNANAGHEGAAIVALLNGLSGITSGPYAAAAAAFNTQVSAANAYSQGLGTVDAPIHPASLIAATTFNLTATTAAGADVMRLTGGQDVRIDMTNPANQITGLDLDGDGTIEFDGKERSVTGKAANFEIVDAYSRNPLNHSDIANNFLGDIAYDGTGFDGDGVKTNGNIVLGGLGVDTIFGGVGNDFLAGGGIAQGRAGADTLSGGRNADFFFAEFSGIDRTDGGPTLVIDGGNTADSISAANGQSSQDADWLLFEASDDDEPVIIWLNDDNPGVGGTPGVGPEEPGDGIGDNRGRVLSRSGESMTIDDIENVDASGNLYGFLNGMNVEIGGRAVDTRDAAGTSNYGLGSSAQLDIRGSNAANIIIAGYDNDVVQGNGGSDLLMGGNLQQLLETVTGGRTNPNLGGIVNDGRDDLRGGDGDDNIVFEADNGVIDGGAGADTLWLTKYSLGTRTAATMLADGRLRFDLTSENGITEGLAAEGGAGYGGANSGTTADQTNYASGITARVTVTTMESIDATGLGAIDFKSAGTNDPELKFSNQQNFKGYNGDLQLLGTQGANNLYAGAGNDEIHGRGGNDDMQGGLGDDDFYFALDGDFAVGGASGGDGVDQIRRKVDANGDDLWDTTSTGAVVWGQDFGLGGTVNAQSSTLTIVITNSDDNLDVRRVSFFVNGTEYVSQNLASSLAADISGLVTKLQTDLTAQAGTSGFVFDVKSTAAAGAVAGTITVNVTPPAGSATSPKFLRTSDTAFNANSVQVVGGTTNSTLGSTATDNPGGVNVSGDRLIYKAWEDRSDNEGVDDDTVLGSTMSLGKDAYGEDLVISFQADGTRLAEDQSYTITFDNLTTQDRVTVNVNGVTYMLQVGIDLDGNIIAGEDGVGDTQTAIQTAFLARLADFITNSFADRNTVAGKVLATATATTIVLTQQAYNGEETVFMRTPSVSLENLSGGQAATATVTNNAQHEVLLFQFDGRDNKLNETNVLFWGQEAVQRANLETAKAAGGALAGTDALVIDGFADDLADSISNYTKAAVANNQATNAPLQLTNFTVHGDDFLLGGAGIDQITGGTGDDRIIGSAGSATAPALGATSGEVLDGGKNVYAVQVLGETKARVYVLNKWEARNPTLVADLAGLTISSITPIRDNETGLALSGGTTVAETMFDDTLQFEQETFGANAQFTVSLDDFVVSGGVVQTRNDGAGLVWVDVNGNGVHDAGVDTYTRFTNFENIRTVSGSGKAVAGDKQGNDTLDATLLSSTTTGAGGISYNLTSNVDAGEVRYSKDAIITGTDLGTSIGDRPTAGDYEELVIKVDGVENVLTSTGADLLRIDETEAAKNNLFSAGLGVDKIVYEDDFDGGAGTVGAGMPTVTIKVNTGTDTDQVVMKGGRVGTLSTPTGGAVDTLIGVEYVELGGETAQSKREDDTLDVSAMATGAVVDYTNGEIRTGVAAGSGVQLVVEGIVQIEKVIADGNDLVIVADADVMNNNVRSDEGVDATAATNILFMTYRDYDDLVAGSTARKSFTAQVLAGEIQQVINQGQFSFALSEVGTDADVDRVAYNNELGRIVVPVGQGVFTVPGAATNKPQYVVVDGNSNGNFADTESRVDALWGVEEIVAAAGESVMDFTSGNAARQITFKYVAPATGPAENQVVEQTIRIADGTGNTLPGLNAFVERYVYNKTTPAVADATWNRIEGSDAQEIVIYEGSEDLVNASGLDHRFTNDTITLRGGNNEVRYSPLETSISASIAVVEEDATTTTVSEGKITATITFQDGKGVSAPSATFLGGTHVITSNTSDNTTAAGNLKIEASQDAEDVVSFTATSPKLFILGTSPGVINVNIGALNAIVLTGFEFLQDAATDDVYDIRSISSIVGLKLLDDAGRADHDAIRVANDSVNYNGSGVNTIDLDNISATVGGFDFEFDVLDVTLLTSALTGLTLNGGTNAAPVETDADEVADNTDEVVLGALARVSTINDFESMVLTEASVAAGTTFTFNPATNALVQGSTTVTTAADILSFGGLVLEQLTGFNKSYVPAATTGVNVTIAGGTGGQVHGGNGADTITGGSAADTIRGNGGNDTLSGGVGVEVRTVQIVGVMDGVAGNTVTLTFDGDGGGAGTYAVTVTEGVEIATGSGSSAVADALAAKITTNLAALNTAALWNGGGALQSVTSSGGILTFRFTPGVDITGTIIGAETDAGATFAVSGETVVTNGGDGGADRFLFEATASANGADTINDVTLAGTGDIFDFTAFFGGASVLADLNGGGAGVAANSTGAISLASGQVGVLFNKATLAASDIVLAAAAGKVAVPNNGKAVVIVTGDTDGTADATNEGYKIYFVQDTDATAAQSYAVTLVGTVNSSAELDATLWAVGNIG